MNLEIKPDTLCIVMKGPSCGTSVMAIRLAEPGEVETILSRRFSIPDVRISETSPIWHVDKLIAWQQQYTGMETEILFEAAANLLPIPPLADPLDCERSRELEHS